MSRVFVAPDQIAGTRTYLTDAEAVWNMAYNRGGTWTRTNLRDSTGQVNECMGSSGESRDSNVYNGGLMLNAAAILYANTGTQQYYDDAVLIAAYQTKRWPVVTPDYPNNGPFGCDQFFRGLSNFARWNGLWSQYYPWLKTTATAAWNTRRTDYDISHNDYAVQTPGRRCSRRGVVGRGRGAAFTHPRG